ncbi:endoplasmic reticulum membrane-associated RNA degradation protein isoform X8 [Ranitomeya imitator]|uniref:endoplasmic reticulum membrane-associated RNA degradation protein isoform X8 n=1 Tax=Ranitomeya imitator TaxID=111125 RepID=UPI0037E9A534
MMPGSFPVGTCLSPAVYNMVCLVGFEVQNSIEIRSFLNEDNHVCWSQICEQVSYLPSGEELDYVESVRNLGPLCDAVHTLFMSLPNEKYEEAFHQWFQWTNNCELFLLALNSLKSLDGTKISLFLMKITSCLERSLGDAYLLIGTDCPFLLRDLLSSKELAKIFSQTVMDVLKIFLGSPQSLNLRNLLWHGFMSPHEISPKYFSMILLLTAGLGQLLQSWLSNTTMSLVHRPYFVFSNLQEIAVFPDLNEKVLSFGESLIEKSTFVLANMVPFWMEAITAFRQDRFADCAIFLLPQLETGLRLAFCTVNECPNRMLTAQVLQCCESLQKWELLPIPSLEHPSKTTEPQDNVDASLSFFSEIRKILSLLHLQGKKCCFTEDCSSWLQTHRWFVSITELCRQRISNLYCPRMVLEAVNILRKVSIQCHHVSENIVSTSKLRYEQWQNKTLRSRQRQNYQRLLFSIKSLAPVLRLIITIVVVDLHNIHSLSEEAHLEYQKYLKHLKCILQYTENMSTCTSPKKNRWDETIHLTNRIILKITAFNENSVAE